ncbi:MAG: tRNA (adenosine(37)-N6)-dimethylallyltransferase MiaA [Lentisphaeria bacterium]|nr:tRNA (adenosine(37)-N6)-dimethylallyltransferase MiaA [Lentisphaeria bacterium]
MGIFCETSGPAPVKVLAVTGPTATGKTALAVKLAERFGGEIVSVDSRQVYRGLDIGSGKDIEEYGNIPYHLIDIADPAAEVYNLARFCADAFAAVKDIADRGRLPVLCGGTALYLLALLAGYRLPGTALPPRNSGMPRTRQAGGGEDSFSPPFPLDALVLGVYYPRAEVRERIRIRLDKRLEEGMLDEGKRLLASGVSLEKMEFFGLEYREMARFLAGKCTRREMRDVLLNRIRQFAKRQDIFFRKMEREGHVIHWLDRGDFGTAVRLTGSFLAGEALPPPDFRLTEIVNPSRPVPERRPS